MSTLAEIEAAAKALPLRQKRKLISVLTATLPAAKPRQKLSLHERMKAGCGIVDSGVTDLATNKKHMEGFGQWKRT